MPRVKARTRRGFGAIRKLPSGRYQASYLGPDLNRYKARSTYETKTDAEGWLAKERRLVDLDTWTPPETRQDGRAQGVTLSGYAPEALARRRNRHGDPLRPRTLDLYTRLLDRVILPSLGDQPMVSITEAKVNAWYDSLEPTQPTQRAHAYALLKSLFIQAIDEKRVTMANPCRIKGAGRTSRKRNVVVPTMEELELIMEATPERLKALILLCAWCGLRFGEVIELRRRDIDLKSGVVEISRAVVRVDRAELVGSPKSDEGSRRVAIPPHIVPVIANHLKKHVGKGRDALLFPHHPGTDKHWTHGMFFKAVFMPAREHAGRPDLRLHDLRHGAAVMAAQTGATLAELMARLGHSTPDAAMRYQSVARNRDAEIAAALSRAFGGHDEAGPTA